MLHICQRPRPEGACIFYGSNRVTSQNGKRGINTKNALLFDAALGIESSLWLELQADYDLFTAKPNKCFMRQLNKIRKVAAVIVAFASRIRP